jgi:8-oxo-dGTP pyrophosphatase MutT (NUDIX family)
MDHDSRHSVSVAGIVLDSEGRALLIQRRDNGHWEPPGGVLERAEDIETGLRREVLEETGLHVESVDLSGVYKNMTRGVIALVFRCRIVGGDLHETEESQAFTWVTRDEVHQYATEAYAVRVLDAMTLESPAIRQHDGTRLIPARS